MKSVQEILESSRALLGEAPGKAKRNVQAQTLGVAYSSPFRTSVSAFFLSDHQPKIYETIRHAFCEFNNTAHINDGWIMACFPLHDEEEDDWVLIHGHPCHIMCAAPYMCFESTYRPKNTDHPEFTKQFYIKWKGLKK